jgi:hypothetical protein
VMFFAVVMSLLACIGPIFGKYTDCNSLEDSDSNTELWVFVTIRVCTHFLPVALIMFVFWHSRQEQKPDYLRFSARTFSQKSWDLSVDAGPQLLDEKAVN